jgi:hypothetical protein
LKSTLKDGSFDTSLLLGIQLTHVQRHLGSTVKMFFFSYKIFTFNDANTLYSS